jgi:hypothetical protein
VGRDDGARRVEGERTRAVATVIPGTAATLLRLQSTLGNRASGKLLLQLQDPAIAALLDSARRARARRFYESQPKLYTPEILSRIQQAVGVPETGTVTDELILGVARFQSGPRGQGAENPESRLVVDGMAGPRTLPIMFPSGLGSGGAMREYALDLRAFMLLLRDKDAEHRRRLLGIFLGRRFDALGIPKPKIVLGPDNNFDHVTWTIQYREAGLARIDVDDPDQLFTLAAGTYHEARHCEQSFREAQMLAGQGRTAAEIMKIMGLKRQDVADAAVRAPIAPGTMDAVVATGWFESEYGSGRAHRDVTLQNLRTHTEAAQHEYRQLPEEFDAFYVAGEMGDLLGGKDRGLP